MALAELDREHGVLEEEEPEINPDLFVKVPRTHRVRPLAWRQRMKMKQKMPKT